MLPLLPQRPDGTHWFLRPTTYQVFVGPLVGARLASDVPQEAML